MFFKSVFIVYIFLSYLLQLNALKCNLKSTSKFKLNILRLCHSISNLLNGE